MKDVEIFAAMALNRIFGFTPKYSHCLIENAGSCAAVFDFSTEQLVELLGTGNSKITSVTCAALEESRTEYFRLRQRGYDFIPISSPEYPQMLLDCQDSPLGLYIRSSSPVPDIFSRRPSVSIVGTRDISFYGKDCCESIVRTLSSSPEKPTVVSGLAIGVDITAHMAALACGLPTIAVLPCGIDSVYPIRHSVAADKISSSPGSALVTDYPPGSGPQAYAFLRRNRIIAGLSSQTILVESRNNGGGMMTARLAADYGREVFAVPGRLGDERSEGCNILCRERTAEPIVSTGRLLRQLRLSGTVSSRHTGIRERIIERYRTALPDKSEALALVCTVIAGNPGITIDGLCEVSGMDFSSVTALQVILENDGILETDLLRRCFIHANFI